MAWYKKIALTWLEPYVPGMEDGINSEGKPIIHTLEGDYIIQDTDWIATGVKNERWPIKEDIVKKTYEFVKN